MFQLLVLVLGFVPFIGCCDALYPDNRAVSSLPYDLCRWHCLDKFLGRCLLRSIKIDRDLRGSEEDAVAGSPVLG
jgi:hypothetical protein